MQFNKEEVVSIAGSDLEKDTIQGSPDFEWIDLVGIPQRPIELKENLFFTSHSTGEGGWTSPFDRRPIAEAVYRDKGWPLVIEPGLEIGGTEYLQVRSLDVLAERIYDVARERTNPYIVGITGSVGKTTSVAFLEHLLETSGEKVSRFYSKRLTPLSVMCHYINRVDADTSFVVMEYSAYMKEHVSELSQLLPPNISFLTNIYATHINPDSFTSKREIFDSKEHIKPKDSLGFVNARTLHELGLVNPTGWSPFEIESPNGLSNPILPPTLRTAEMYTVGKLFASNIGISEHNLHRAYESFVPQEKRIVLCNVHGHPVYFHGETSGGSRLWSWFETVDGSVPNLFVEEVNFADEDPHGFIQILEEVFDSSKTWVLDTPLNRERLPVNAHFLDETSFYEKFSSSTGYTIYHKALSTRLPDFDPQGYLENRI